MKTQVEVDDRAIRDYAKAMLGMTDTRKAKEMTAEELFAAAFEKDDWIDAFKDSYLEDVKDEFGLFDEQEALDYATEQGYISEDDALQYARDEGYMDEDEAREYAKELIDNG